jgi:drug/metabolite transporter (DMT)-like permease
VCGAVAAPLNDHGVILDNRGMTAPSSAAFTSPPPPHRFSPRTIGIASAIITVAIWTSFIVIARWMALKSLAPLDIVWLRFLGASIVLLPWGYWMVSRMSAGQRANTWLRLSPLPMKITLAIGLFGGIAYSCLVYLAFTFAPASHGSVLLPGMLPLSTALFTVLILRERLSSGRWLGLAIILCGGMLVGGWSIVQALMSPDAGQVWKGDVLFVCASSCWAVYTVLCRKYQLDAVQATIAVIVLCALTYLPLYPALVWLGIVQSKLMTAPTWEIAFQASWQGMMSVVISGITFTKMIQYFGPVRSTMLTALVPGLSAMGAVIFLSEPLTWNLLAGLALVTVGIIIGVRAAAVKPT